MPLLQPMVVAFELVCSVTQRKRLNTKMRKEIRVKLDGDESRKDASAAFTLPFDTRDVWGKAKVPVRVTINGYTIRFWKNVRRSRVSATFRSVTRAEYR